MAQAACNNQKAPLTSQYDLSLRKMPLKYCIWNIAVYGAESWTLREVERRCVGSFGLRCVGGNWLLKHVIEGKVKITMEARRIRGKRRKQQSYGRKEMKRHLELEKEALDHTL
jgi:hypothetical protein